MTKAYLLTINLIFFYFFKKQKSQYRNTGFFIQTI